MSHPMVFINLPVQDLPRARGFFAALGYSFNEQFCDETAACLVLSEANGIYAMLLTHEKTSAFTDRAIADANKTTEVLICLAAENRAHVDRLYQAALAAGAAPMRDLSMGDFMYGKSFADLDGHIWELMWMDPVAAQAAAS